MNNPIDTNAYTHWLIFESLGRTEHQICQPFGIKDVPFTLKQKDGLFGRDFSYIASGDKAVKFVNAIGELALRPQVINPQGDVSQYLDYGIAWILESDRQFGFESKVKYVLKKNGLQMDAGYLSCVGKDSDGYTYFACNVIQPNEIGDYKRHETDAINLLSNKNIRFEAITPIDTMKVLRKSVPVYLESELQTQGGDTTQLVQAVTGRAMYFNKIKSITKSGIITTKVWGDDDSRYNLDIDNYDPNRNTFMIVDALRKLNNLKVKITLSMLLTLEDAGGSNNDRNIFRCHLLRANSGTFDENFGPGIPADVWASEVLGDESGIYIQDVNTVIDLDLGELEIGGKIWFVFSFNSSSEQPIWKADMRNSKIEISSNQTSVNTVMLASRRIDVMKQCSKFIRNIPVNAARWDIGGEFYDEVCYNRSLVSQNLTVPFITTFLDCFSMLQEVCGDYENKLNEIFCGLFPDFYENVEIGVFRINPNAGSKKLWNDRVMINKFVFGYDKYQEDSNLGQNSKEDAHTEGEWSIPNEMASNTLERKMKWVRSGYSAQKAVDLEINKPATADSTDNDVYLTNIVPLPEDSFNEFSATLEIGNNMPGITILNRASTGDPNNVVINWMIMGPRVGDPFFITAGVNIGEYIVTAISPTTITLNTVSVPGDIETGDQFIRMKYFYYDVYFQTQTDEGFSLVSGVTAPKQYPNLKNTLRRNMVYWESLLNTACSFVRGKIIQNLKFISNGLLKTQYTGGRSYTENELIPVDSLQARIISADSHQMTCFCSYEEAVAFLEAYKLRRGFVRAVDIEDNVIKGFFSSFEFYIAKDQVVFVLEGKFEEQTLKLKYVGGILMVNDFPYDLEGNSQWWELSNGRFKAYDKDNVPLCNWTNYKDVEFNGIVYNTANELLDALLAL